MIPIALAPRVYLDTAYLCDFADGKVREGDLDLVCSAMSSMEAVLVFGPAHMVDLHRRTKRETRERLFAIVDRFPRAATIQSLPMADDHSRLDSFLLADDPTRSAKQSVALADAVLEDCTGNLKGALVAGGYDEANWLDISLTAELLSIEGSGHSPDEGEPLPAELRRVLHETFAMEIRGEDGVANLVEKSVHPRLRSHPEVLASEARLRALHSEYAPFLRILGELATNYGGTVERLARQLGAEGDGVPVWWQAVPNGTERWLAAARILAPGLYLKTALLQAKNRDSRRQPKPSDNADEFHMTVIPYVDVMTIDRENLAIMNRHVPDLQTVRKASLVRNRDIEALVRAVKAVPRSSG